MLFCDTLVHGEKVDMMVSKSAVGKKSLEREMFEDFREINCRFYSLCFNRCQPYVVFHVPGVQQNRMINTILRAVEYILLSLCRERPSPSVESRPWWS